MDMTLGAAACGSGEGYGIGAQSPWLARVARLSAIPRQPNSSLDRRWQPVPFSRLPPSPVAERSAAAKGPDVFRLRAIRHSMQQAPSRALRGAG